MARVTYGPLVTAVKGSIGGITFQNNSSGAIIRSRPRPTRSSTNKQTSSHAFFAEYLHQYQLLSLTEKQAWNTYATTWSKINKFGQSKILTGQNWFQSINYWRVQMDLSILSDPPTHLLPASPPSFEIVFTDESINLNLTSSFNFTENSLILWSTIPTRRTKTTVNQIRKLIKVWNADPGNPVDITALWEAQTNTIYNPTINFPSANIFFCLQSCLKSSGITSSMLCTVNNTPSADEGNLYYYL